MKPLITQDRIEILELLAEHKVLTTGQIWYALQPTKARSHTWRELSMLQKLELVTSYTLEPERGGASETAWRLTKRGADEINIPFNKFRQPSKETVLFKSVRLELERRVKEVGWVLTKPTHYNPEQPKPVKTRQYEILVKALDYRLAAQDKNKNYRLYVPLEINEYLASTSDNRAAKVLILNSPRSGEKFWQRRKEIYERLAARYPIVYATFARPELLTTQLASSLADAKIQLVTLENIPTILNNFF